MAHSVPSDDREPPLNLELLGYDELGRMPTIGRSTDRESLLRLQECFTHPGEHEIVSPRTREFLANDFGGF